MTNKLVIINRLKYQKLRNFYTYEMKFLLPNYSYIQNPWLGGYCPHIPVLSVLCSQLNLLTPTPPNKIPGYATAVHIQFTTAVKLIYHVALQGKLGRWGYAHNCGLLCILTSEISKEKTTAFLHEIKLLETYKYAVITGHYFNEI